VYLEGDTVRLSLPHDDPDEALELLDDVTDIVAVHWIAEELVPAASLDTLQARFKSAGAIIASAQGCEVDGDLMEWAGDGALAVGGAGHLVQGGRNWKGDRDASFAVAARLAPHALCAAVRVRDDQILPGEDLLTVITDKARFELPVPEQPGRLQEGALQAAFTDRAAFGVGVEFCLHPTSWSVHEGHVPLRVLFRDRDGEGETVIASAPELPWPALAGVRLPRHGRTGALPER
jgi:hypothetical protein